MSFGEFCNRALPLFKAAACSIGGCDRLVDYNLRVSAVGKDKGPLAAHLMPARASDNGDAGLDESAVEISHKVLSKASCNYLKPMVGQGGAKRGTVTVKVLVCNWTLMDHT